MQDALEYESPERRRGGREQLRLLDGCLYELENANERGEQRVSVDLASRLRWHVPAIAHGMRIRHAMDLVFRAQEPHLLADEGLIVNPRRSAPWLAGEACDAHAEPPPDGVSSGLAPLDEASARTLTDEIRRASTLMCVLLLEAHERYAWSALGYTSWEQYARRELGLSRSRSYELLDQGRVVLAVKVAAGTTEMPAISAYAAMEIKPHLDEVLRDVRERTHRLGADDAQRIIGEVVQEFRARFVERRRARLTGRRNVLPAPATACMRKDTGLAPPVTSFDLSGLFAAVRQLASMPSAADVASRILEDQSGELDDLDAALAWLADFVAAWSARRAHGRRQLVGLAASQ